MFGRSIVRQHELEVGAGVDGRIAVCVRGWAENEPAILVDGLPAPASVVDLVVSATAFVDSMRAGDPRLVVAYPNPANAREVELWALAGQLCQDRLGIDRGVLEFAPAAEVPLPVGAGV